MNCQKILYINDEPINIINDSVALSLDNVSNGIFVVPSSDYTLGDAVTYGLYEMLSGQIVKKQTILRGYISDIVQVAKKVNRILVKENADKVISELYCFSCTNCGIANIAAKLSADTGVSFSYNKDLGEKIIGNFVGFGTGKEILQQIANAFDVPNFSWISENQNNNIWFGDYSTSEVAAKTIAIPHEFTSEIGIGGVNVRLMIGAKLGIKVAVGIESFKLTQINISNNTMRLKWI